MWKILAVALYAGVLLVIGYLASRRMRDIRDYFAAGKRLGFINVAFSARATGESSWLLLGLSGMAFLVGPKAFWVILGELLGVGCAWLLLARRFKRLTDKYDSITVPDYLESRFRDAGHWIRLLAAGSLLIFAPIYAGVQVHATGKAFSGYFDLNQAFGIDLSSLLGSGWEHYIGAAIGFAIVMIYITQGGFVAVVWSDVFQGLLMVTGLVVLPIVAALEVAGVTHLLSSPPPVTPDRPPPTPWTLTDIFSIAGLVLIGLGFLGSPQIFVRFIAIRSDREILPGAATAIVWTLLADTGAVMIGLIGRSLFSIDQLSGDVERILPVMSSEMLHPFLAGLYIAMVLAAIMSTIDSLLVLAASAAVRDYWQKIRRPDMPDDRLVSLSRTITIALSLLTFAIGVGLIAYNPDGAIFWMVLFGWSGIAATFCPVIVLSLFWPGLTALGAKLSMLSGILAVPFYKFVAPALLEGLGWAQGRAYLEALDVIPPSFATSAAVAVVVSLLDRRGRDRLRDVRADLRDVRG